MSNRRELPLPHFGADVLWAWGIVAFIAFIGIAAVVLRWNRVSSDLLLSAGMAPSLARSP